MIEIFKDIEGYEGLYQISNYGNVKSLGNCKYKKDKILKYSKDKDGYLYVGLCKNGKHKYIKIHRLVAEAFIENPNNYQQVNHKDEDKTNNHVTNLEWCTPKYNSNYGTRIQRVIESQSRMVECIETGIVYSSTIQVERELGFKQSSISRCCNGIRNTCGGFHWCYV